MCDLPGWTSLLCSARAGGKGFIVPVTIAARPKTSSFDGLRMRFSKERR